MVVKPRIIEVNKKNIKKMDSEEFVKKMHVDECGSKMQRKATWEMQERVKEYMCRPPGRCRRE